MIRKIIAALLATALLCGCAQEQPQSEEEALTVVGISQVGAESDWRVANSESMKEVFTEEKGYRLLFEDARQIQENQIMAVRKFIQQQVDYIVLLPLSETGWDTVLQEARDAGIPVILADRMVEVEDDSLYTAHVGSDVYSQGLKAARWLEAHYGGKPANIIHIQGALGSTPQLGRTWALDEAVDAQEDWQILTRLDGDFTRAKAYEALGEYLDTLPQEQSIQVVYCENDNEAFGAIEALEERGYRCGQDVDIISFDATRSALQLCMEGKISLVVECNPLLGPMVEEIIQTVEAGQTPKKQQYVEEKAFTQTTLTQATLDARSY